MEHELRDHVIVCGLQGVGFRIVEQLYLSGTPVIVIDAEADVRFARILEDWGVPHLQRSAYLGGDALMDAAYDDQVYVDDRTIDSHIKRLRKKFKAVDSSFDVIETLYGVGYRFKE